MALTTKLAGHIVIAENPENIVFGTCMIGETYGSVESAGVKRGADLEEIEKCGGSLLAAIMRKGVFELTLKTLFTADVEPPGLGDKIVFPLAGIEGRVVPSVDIDWEKAGQRMLSINVKSWDDLPTNGGAGSAKMFDGTTYTDLDA